MKTDNQPKSLELYLFDFCPYAQRVNITLIQSTLPFKRNVLDARNLPENFSEISPLGNVPVLKVNDSDIIFESSIINDFIAEISPVSLEPDNIIKRTQMRAWNEYASSCLGFMMNIIQSESDISVLNRELIQKVNFLDSWIDPNGPYFYGQQFTTIDSTYAPLFQRMETLNHLSRYFSMDGLTENIIRWKTNLLNSEPLKKSLAGNFETIYKDFIHLKGDKKLIDREINGSV